MDLVDIDKVLDDFELSDERTGAAAAVDPGRRAFVNVSSVFSSLNDYVGVEIAPKSTVEVHAEAAVAAMDEKVNGETTVSEEVPNSAEEEETLERSSEIALSLTTTTESSSDLSNPSINTTEISEDGLSLDAGAKVSNMLTLESSSICIDNEISSSILPSRNFGNNMSTLSRITETEDNSEPEVSDEMPQEEVIIPRETPQPPIKVPVGFEETMDDVSDTELESYLQELENESIRETVNAQVVPTVEKVEEPTKAVDQHDSVSQASTVEITDTKKRIEIDFDDESTSNSSLLEEKVTEEVADEPTTCSVSTSEVEVHQRDAALGEEEPTEEPEVELRQKVDVEEVAEVAEEAPQVAEAKPQRPDSLDLSMVSNNVGFAGQTPMQQAAAPVEEGAVGGEDEAVSGEAAAQMSTSSSDDFTPMAQPPAVESSAERRLSSSLQQLGKVAPYWVPDNVTNFCMQCNLKFSLIKRRHHCRACGQVLCSTCCSLKGKLEYLGDVEARICIQCDAIMSRDAAEVIMNNNTGCLTRSPNPNNPMEYCSTIPPHQQVSGTAAGPIAVMVPAGVLKKEGAPPRNRKDKTVIFSDGIRPGCDLTELDGDESEGRSSRRNGNWRVQTPPGPTNAAHKSSRAAAQNVKLPVKDKVTGSYIPKEENLLPPIYIATKTDFRFEDVANNATLIARLRQETLKFAIHRNFHIHVKIIELTCCMNRTVFNFTTHGLRFVGQDEIIILLEMDDTEVVPKDIFLHLCEIYSEADRGQTITELGYSLASTTNFLGSREHGGFLYIRPTFQCLQGVCVPEPPYLIGILIHKWEIPWARLFPLRLQLRLGAYYRYYPSPHVSFRGRESVYTEISDTIINFLADFRTYSYTLSSIRGLMIHMEEGHTTVMIPRNRYDQVMKAINNSSDNILAIGGNFSRKADGHLVCIQNTDADSGQLHAYSTQAINIEGHPRNVTGASFIVLNGALKTTSGLTGKCSIVEDGLMVQILPAKMETVRTSLKNMKDVTIVCGAIDADPSQTENVNIVWTDNDLEFNVGVVSPIDNKKMDGIPSIRVHKGQDFSSANHIIRWTEVFILKVEDDTSHSSVNIPKVAEQIAQSTAVALVSFLDLLAANGLRRIGLRTTLDQETVCYEAGSHQQKLPPLYMDVLDNELIPTLHRQVTNLQIDNPIIVELIFDILDK